MATPSTRLQQEAALWSTGPARVYAMLDGAALPGLLPRLSAAGLPGWDCLRRGALPPDEAGCAPYLAELPAGAPFTRWLLDDISPTVEAWGVFVRSPLRLRPLREALRQACDAQDPQGRRFTLRWWDPAVVQALLPTCSPAQLQQVLQGIDTLVVAGARQWTWYRESVGQLVPDVRLLT